MSDTPLDRLEPADAPAWARLVQSIGGFPLFTALLIVSGTLYLATTGGLFALQGAANQWRPFLASLVGVSLYMMGAAKSYKERFEYRYLPDYCYRIAQSMVYTYAVLAIFAQTSASSSKDFSTWPPNLIGLLIGLFILHVEKAMEGFGERFGEALSAVLGRSLEGKTPREKQMDRIRDEKKLEEIRQQAELMASQAPGRAALAGFQKRIAEVTTIVREGEPDAIHDDVVKLSWEFEQLKVALREETTTVAEVLGRTNALLVEQ